ncbi:conserved hypothetical protein [Leishmania braziliensis MHOM/BR/75/M2904]|uniref:Uncharacterized protein n=1 Tax=Leishmania braziliensis TaxID=5660 RepID=A4HGL6_LEIBR|nr:conserved hypothetical protein [Leishmania braziliensis MHOM/BR/75/M2904]CAJ2475907.1 unnamed protein product [Leishmania braziliensis]CAM39710.1 conserved hypothetical protein [Leishmania braziliensis MHOM/BR/75/M2904]
MMLVERAQLLTLPSPYSFPVFSTFCSSLPAAAAAAASLPLPPLSGGFFVPFRSPFLLDVALALPLPARRSLLSNFLLFPQCVSV